MYKRNFNTDFKNRIIFPRIKLSNVERYKVIVVEKTPNGPIKKDPVYIEQIKNINPVKGEKTFTPSISNVYSLPPNIIHTSFYKIEVEINNNYISEDKFKFESFSNNISLDESIILLESDTIKVHYYTDSIVYEFNSNYECNVCIDVEYNKSFKVGVHNILI